MNTSRLMRNISATAMILSLAACMGATTPGGPTPGGAQPAKTFIPPLKGMTSTDYQALQNRKVIGKDGERTEFTSFATSENNDTTFNGPVGRTTGAIVISSGETDGDTTKIPTIFYAFGRNSDNGTSHNPDYGNRTYPDGSSTIEGGQESINGQRVYVGQKRPAGGYTHVLYIPRGDSQMYAGAYVRDEIGAGAHGVFGRKTTASELGIITGSANYKGAAAASVSRYDGVTDAESGLYEGETTANLNFNVNTITINGTVSRDHEYSAGRDTIGIRSSGTFDANGKIVGTTTFDGLSANGKVATGNFQGNFFGPKGQTIGGTFIGGSSATAAGPQEALIVGHTIMNKN
ncbi:transferrin-binding protein-like solute binding protein [Loktanella sp. DJP18]|uniref:transferrin-binding protein-like solute binding protein n=1 Tax=Loktanella sp. DJP18 TaxID=3409788 RepID=UPI003BB48CE4